MSGRSSQLAVLAVLLIAGAVELLDGAVGRVGCGNDEFGLRAWCGRPGGGDSLGHRHQTRAAAA